VLHRDIKPTNILLNPRADFASENLTRLDQAQPMLTDFGLAKILEDENHLTPTGLTVGTAHYMAPEQLTHSRSVGPPADVYSLGVVLYEMLSGATPEVASAVLPTRSSPARAFVPLRSIRPDVSPALEAICHRCLEEDLELRYPTAADLRDDLNRILA
jgi:serine/threonine protein kinase